MLRLVFPWRLVSWRQGASMHPAQLAAPYHCEELGAGRFGGGQAGIFGGDPAEYRPIAVLVATGNGGDETVANHAGHRHRDTLRFGCLEHQANILQAERDCEPRRFVLPFYDE